jgi:hypothetical protein
VARFSGNVPYRSGGVLGRLETIREINGIVGRRHSRKKDGG